MSRRLIARSPDLLRLQNEGFDISVQGGYLLVLNVPYVNASRAVRLGTLISTLELAGDVTVKPTNHVAYWTGEHPCHHDGRKISAFENPSAPQDFGDGIRADFTFSAKADYRDYHHKMTTYLGRIVAEAQAIDPSATAQRFSPIAVEDGSSVFVYEDTASSRAGTGALNEKFVGRRIGVAGLGGTGSYVLDLVAKTPVAEIHLFDGDYLLQHNAFRAPGAATLAQLRGKPKKVAYFAEMYSHMRRGIIPHAMFLDETNVDALSGLDFVFLCIDRAPAKRTIVRYLAAHRIPFIDVGMGVLRNEDGLLGGIVRVTTSTPETRAEAAPHISFSDDDGGINEYTKNIQIADLNALNASLAVGRWKRLVGFYRDARRDFYSGYSIASGQIVNEGVDKCG